MNRSSFRDNHMAFAAGLLEEEIFVQLPIEEPVALRLGNQIGGRVRNLPPVSGNPLERVKSSHFSATGSPIGSRTSSPACSLHSNDSLRGSRRPSVRSHVSDTRRRLISVSWESGKSEAFLEPLTSKDVTSSEDSNEDSATQPLWLESSADVASEEKYFTSPTKSKIHFLKCISSQRSLLGPNYVYGGATEKSPEEEQAEDDAIDSSLKKTFNRQLDGEGMFLDDFLSRHFNHPLEVNMENLDAISDCTDDDGY